MQTHIQYSERRAIEYALSKKQGVRAIARRLVRSPSSISEEIRKGSVKGVYQADKAQARADRRRKQAKQKCLKVALNPKLKEYVTEQIREKQSPEAVSGRIRTKETCLPKVSPKAIYNFVYSVHGRPIERFLYSNRVKKKGGPKRGSAPPRDAGKVSIDARPKQVEKRLVFGHFEGDFIVSGKGGTGALLVLVERKTRYPFLIPVADRSAVHINELIEYTLRDIPVKSITLDNDVSFAKHEELSALIDATVYFCHAYASHEKGTVENRNGRIREFIPKRTNIAEVSLETIQEAEAHLRTRYMKCLGWETSQEAWNTEMEQWHYKKSYARIQKNAPSVRETLSVGVRLLG